MQVYKSHDKKYKSYNQLQDSPSPEQAPCFTGPLHRQQKCTSHMIKHMYTSQYDQIKGSPSPEQSPCGTGDTLMYKQHRCSSYLITHRCTSHMIKDRCTSRMIKHRYKSHMIKHGYTCHMIKHMYTVAGPK